MVGKKVIVPSLIRPKRLFSALKIEIKSDGLTLGFPSSRQADRPPSEHRRLGPEICQEDLAPAARPRVSSIKGLFRIRACCSEAGGEGLTLGRASFIKSELNNYFRFI